MSNWEIKSSLTDLFEKDNASVKIDPEDNSILDVSYRVENEVSYQKPKPMIVDDTALKRKYIFSKLYHTNFKKNLVLYEAQASNAVMGFTYISDGYLGEPEITLNPKAALEHQPSGRLPEPIYNVETHEESHNNHPLWNEYQIREGGGN